MISIIKTSGLRVLGLQILPAGISRAGTVKLGNKERFIKEQIGIKELFMDYQLFYTINLLLDKELLPILKIPKLGISEHEIVKSSKKGDFRKILYKF